MVFNDALCGQFVISFPDGVLGGFEKSRTAADLFYGNNHILRGTYQFTRISSLK